MVRLRNALMIVALAAGAFGCAHLGGHTYEHWSPWHCSECDDFPTPAYGPQGGMMPGTYSGPPPESESSSRMGTPTSSNATPLNNEAAVTPPEERPTPPTTTPPDMGNTPPTPPPAGNR
jgi:hypothetical protein